MLIFFAKGRLGNQLFQYAFLDTIKHKDEEMVVIGLDEVKTYFEGAAFINISQRTRIARIVFGLVLRRLLDIAGALKIISTIHVDTEVVRGVQREKTTYSTRQGLFSRIVYVEEGYFQSERWFEKAKLHGISLKAKYQKQADAFLTKLPHGRKLIFVHIRRGDYVSEYSISGQSVQVPLSYYQAAMEWHREQGGSTLFVVMSDDKQAMKRIFGSTKDVIISPFDSPGTDLAIMQRCKGAVLSPSSFSWWGSYFMNQRENVIAPKYWLGWPHQVEYQKGSTPSYARKMTVK